MTDSEPIQEVRTKQFVFHNLDKDSRGKNPLETSITINRIKKDGLWTPIDYSILSSDIFFWGGAPGSVAVIIKTPHSESNEFAGRKYSWDKVRLMEPVGKVYSLEDKSIPDYVKEIYTKWGVKVEKAKKGLKCIPPEDIRAIIQWGVEVHDFKNACTATLFKYESGAISELDAVREIRSLAKTTPMTIEILDKSLDKRKIMAKIASSLTTLYLRERNEEVVSAIEDLTKGNIKSVNAYLSPYYKDIDEAAFYYDNKRDAIIWDEEELLRRLTQVSYRLMKMKPSFSDAKKIQKEYQGKIQDELRKVKLRETVSLDTGV